MKALLVVLLMLSCAGCAALAPMPPEVRTVTVGVPYKVSIPCFEEADRPVLPTHTPVAPDATEDQVQAAIAADAIHLREYAEGVDRLFLRCMKSTQEATP